MSNHEAMQRLADRYISDPEFRAQMGQDPKGTVRSHGLSLDDATWQTLKGVEWAGLGEGLAQRVSKRRGRTARLGGGRRGWRRRASGGHEEVGNGPTQRKGARR